MIISFVITYILYKSTDRQQTNNSERSIATADKYQTDNYNRQPKKTYDKDHCWGTSSTNSVLNGWLSSISGHKNK